MKFDLKFWLMVIQFIIGIILGGESKGSAVKKASQKFNISEQDIWRHGGF